MVIALIISVSIAIVFCALFFEERGSTLDYRQEIKDQDGKIRRLEAENLKYSQFERGGKKDLEELDADLICDAVKINGYVPCKDPNSVSFMAQGEKYFITTDRLPYVLLVKQFTINKEEYDIPAMKQAAAETTGGRLFGNVSISDEGDTLSFSIGGIEHQYGHFRDVLVEEIHIVDDLEKAFGEVYQRILKEKEDMERLKANGIPMEDPKPEDRKIVS